MWRTRSLRLQNGAESTNDKKKAAGHTRDTKNKLGSASVSRPPVFLGRLLSSFVSRSSRARGSDPRCDFARAVCGRAGRLSLSPLSLPLLSPPPPAPSFSLFLLLSSVPLALRLFPAAATHLSPSIPLFSFFFQPTAWGRSWRNREPANDEEGEKRRERKNRTRRVQLRTFWRLRLRQRSAYSCLFVPPCVSFSSVHAFSTCYLLLASPPVPIPCNFPPFCERCATREQGLTRAVFFGGPSRTSVIWIQLAPVS